MDYLQENELDLYLSSCIKINWKINQKWSTQLVIQLHKANIIQSRSFVFIHLWERYRDREKLYKTPRRLSIFIKII